ncbi:MAG: prepilin-type N-terminal cleavage/methylation domain-containing protein [Cyanobacteriota bacterium]
MKKNGFTLLELLVTILIIGIVVGISTLPALTLVAKNKLNNAATSVKQMVQEAQSYATTKSTNINLIFSDSSISIQTEDGTDLNTYNFEDNIKFDSTNSGFDNNTLIFNYKGSPVDASGDSNSFSADDLKFTLCYHSSNNDTCKYSKTLYVAPITGTVKEE